MPMPRLYRSRPQPNEGADKMHTKNGNGRAIRRGLTVAGIVSGAMLLVATTASAGECAPGQMGTNPLKDAATAPAGVTDKVLTSIDLSKEAVKLNDRLFRLRRLEIQPNGIVPMHAHADRPALIYIVQGTVTEYSSNCTQPVVHKAGEAAKESVGLTHWWKNTGDTVVILISADLLHMKKEDGRTM
jgi:quercetin dioxygenase-like cupin family protein